MLAPSKAHVCSGIRSTQDELIRSFKHFRVAICGCITQRDWLPGSYDLAVQVYILSGCACKASVRTVEAQEFFHRCRYERLVFSQLLL